VVNEIILNYDARSKKYQMTSEYMQTLTNMIGVIKAATNTKLKLRNKLTK